VAAVVDTNVLVYRFDARDRRKQKIATDLLRSGIADQSLFLGYQAIIEFYAAVTRPIRAFGPLLTAVEATRETEELLTQFPILYPSEQLDARDRCIPALVVRRANVGLCGNERSAGAPLRGFPTWATLRRRAGD
jgi:predicted nucleic acid-binding protein